ncbi:hypothetical protein LSH36_231g03027 [Paralvinella palmiformis]|uniref:Proliferation-associated SNF2-like protein n=1 Tax=Paralvinella palmiformis TaxID=53620 RepID=A0AAD9JNQ1_9ANNE|nr:hypothetical protein LSH36_231g03027 [Paralvinella palmiformis]
MPMDLCSKENQYTDDGITIHTGSGSGMESNTNSVDSVDSESLLDNRIITKEMLEEEERLSKEKKSEDGDEEWKMETPPNMPMDLCSKENQYTDDGITIHTGSGSGMESNTNSVDSVDSESLLDNRIITKEMLEEEERLNKEKKSEDGDEEWKMETPPEERDKESAEGRYEKLRSLLSKSELYSSYLINRMKSQRAEAEKKLRRLEQRAAKQMETKLQNQQDTEIKTGGEPSTRYHLREVGNMKQESEKKDKTQRKRKAKNANPSNEKADNSSKRRKIAADKTQADDVNLEETVENEQTEECVQFIDGARMYKGEPVHRQQPHLLVGGVLRNYQIEGFNWLKSLYENGVNGILADEMGLGKTIQCISLVAYLIEQGISGPFFICGPLSTVPNWVSEFKRFTPKIPVILYHGSKEERQLLRSKFNQYHPVFDDVRVRPVVITSYGIAMNDRPYIMAYEWKLLIVDEGHRIKNFRCKLITELKMYQSSHRLLLTGTPLQNDLSELWSLLNFLLPEIFDDLGSFEAWFDLSVLQSSDCHEQIVQEEEKKNVLNMIHKILTPFMLRRLKADVDLCIPPKGEIVVYAPMTEMQSNLYKAIIDGSVRSLVGCEKNQKTEVVDLDSNNRPIRKSRKSINYGLFDSNHKDTDSWVKAISEIQEMRKQWDQSEIKDRSSLGAEVNIQLRNVLALLRKACNHPYLISYPLTESDDYKIDEDLVTASGKFLLLDRMLPALKKGGHKVLIFSQMTSTLDILNDYCYLRHWKFCRLDGSVQIEDRRIQIDDFNNDPDTFIFLLSTRAGGLGINLTAADTVIIFDSDWNPQGDIQAEDRCHRIGQTRPVLIYRLVTKNTVDEKIVRRANAKRKLEKMVIHKGQFKRGLNHDAKPVSAISAEELAEILKETDYDDVIENEVISDENLHKLLDRSNLIRKMKANVQQMEDEAASNDEKTKVAGCADNIISQVEGVFEVITDNGPKADCLLQAIDSKDESSQNS